MHNPIYNANSQCMPIVRNKNIPHVLFFMITISICILVVDLPIGHKCFASLKTCSSVGSDAYVLPSNDQRNLISPGLGHAKITTPPIAVFAKITQVIEVKPYQVSQNQVKKETHRALQRLQQYQILLSHSSRLKFQCSNETYKDFSHDKPLKIRCRKIFLTILINMITTRFYDQEQ